MKLFFVLWLAYLLVRYWIPKGWIDRQKRGIDRFLWRTVLYLLSAFLLSVLFKELVGGVWVAVWLLGLLHGTVEHLLKENVSLAAKLRSRLKSETAFYLSREAIHLLFTYFLSVPYAFTTTNTVGELAELLHQFFVHGTNWLPGSTLIVGTLVTIILLISVSERLLSHAVSDVFPEGVRLHEGVQQRILLLERVLTAVFVVLNAYVGIAIVLALKTIVFFRRFEEKAEFFLFTALLNLLLGLACGVLFRQLY